MGPIIAVAASSKKSASDAVKRELREGGFGKGVSEPGFPCHPFPRLSQPRAAAKASPVGMEVLPLALSTKHIIMTLWNGFSEPWRELVDRAVLGADAG